MIVDSLTPEQASEQLAALIFQHDRDHIIGGRARRMFGRRVYEFRAQVAAICARVEPPAREVQLRRQAVNDVDSLDWWTEHAGHIRREYEDALAVIERIRAGRVPEHDPDAVAEAREDAKAREVRQDEAASREAPRVVASS